MIIIVLATFFIFPEVDLVLARRVLEKRSLSSSQNSEGRVTRRRKQQPPALKSQKRRPPPPPLQNPQSRSVKTKIAAGRSLGAVATPPGGPATRGDIGGGGTAPPATGPTRGTGRTTGTGCTTDHAEGHMTTIRGERGGILDQSATITHTSIADTPGQDQGKWWAAI